MSYTTLLQTLFSIIQKVLLSVDPYIFIPLEKEINKRLLVSIAQLGDFGLEIHPNRIALIEAIPNAQTQRHYDCYLTGTLSSFLDMLIKDRQFIPGKGVIISGDIALAQHFFECFTNMDPDWIYRLTAHIPLPLSALLQTLCQPLMTEISRWKMTQSKNFQTFLIDELQALPSRAAMLNFENQIAALQRCTDYLEKNLTTLTDV